MIEVLNITIAGLLGINLTENIREDKVASVTKFAAKIIEAGAAHRNDKVEVRNTEPSESNIVEYIDALYDNDFKLKFEYEGVKYTTIKSQILKALETLTSDTRSTVKTVDGRHKLKGFIVAIGAMESLGLDWSELEPCMVQSHGTIDDFEALQLAISGNAGGNDVVKTERIDKLNQGCRIYESMDDRSEFTRSYVQKNHGEAAGFAQEMVIAAKHVVDYGFDQGEICALSRGELNDINAQLPDENDPTKKRPMTSDEKLAVLEGIQEGTTEEKKRVLTKKQLSALKGNAEMLGSTMFIAILAAIIDGEYNALDNLIKADPVVRRKQKKAEEAEESSVDAEPNNEEAETATVTA